MSAPEAKGDGVAAATKAAVATAAAAYLVKRALEGTGSGASTFAAEGEDVHSRSLPAALGSAPDMLLPLMDHAVEAAGKWVAQNSPELIRDRLLPRFIGAFTDATKRRG